MRGEVEIEMKKKSIFICIFFPFFRFIPCSLYVCLALLPAFLKPSSLAPLLIPYLEYPELQIPYLGTCSSSCQLFFRSIPCQLIC